MFHFIKAIFDISFKLSRPFFGKWKWSVQMINASPECNLPVLINCRWILATVWFSKSLCYFELWVFRDVSHQERIDHSLLSWSMIMTVWNKDNLTQRLYILLTERHLEIKNKGKKSGRQTNQGYNWITIYESPCRQFRCYDDLIINLRKLRLWKTWQSDCFKFIKTPSVSWFSKNEAKKWLGKISI